MEKLLAIAKANSDKVEIFSLEQTINSVEFENSKLKNIECKVQSGISLRLIKDGKLGFSYTKNLISREELLQNALESLKGGVEATFDFPHTKDLPKLSTYNPSIENISTNNFVDECNRVCKKLSSKTKGQINVSAGSAIDKLRIINSSGTDILLSTSNYFLNNTILYPNSYAAIHRVLYLKKFEKSPDEYLQFVLDTYNRSLKKVNPKGGKMKVLFMPETMYVLMWRLISATSGKNLYQKLSPVAEKIGEKIFDEKITIYDDPLNDKMPNARSFDDEGTLCRYLPIIEKGRLKNFYYDLHYSKKMNTKATGHGYKSAMWGGDTVFLKPIPSLEHLHIKPGTKSFSELIKLMDKGIVVAGALGAHSGNIQNGDFSIGLSPGLYVEHGEIVGHVKDAMIAGNIYNAMKNVIDIEDTCYPVSAGTFPAILFDNISVATRR